MTLKGEARRANYRKNKENILRQQKEYRLRNRANYLASKSMRYFKEKYGEIEGILKYEENKLRKERTSLEMVEERNLYKRKAYFSDKYGDKTGNILFQINEEKRKGEAISKYQDRVEEDERIAERIRKYYGR